MKNKKRLTGKSVKPLPKMTPKRKAKITKSHKKYNKKYFSAGKTR